MGKFFAQVNAFNLSDENFCSLGNVNACKRSNFVCALTDYLCVERAVDKNGLSDLFGLFGVKEVAAS